MLSRKIFYLVFGLAACSGGSTEDPIITIDSGENNTNNQTNNVNNTTDVGTDQDPINNVIPQTFTVDLRADTNRDGEIDFDDPTDDTGEDEWNAEHGAIFLANIDDDENACPDNVDDDALQFCYDAADEVINGEEDLKDFARLEVQAYVVPDDAEGLLRITKNSNRVRLFRQNGTDFEVVTEAPLSTSDLKSGVTFFLEAKDVVRDSTWDGFVEFTVEAISEEGNSTDVVEMRVAPILMQHHLLQPNRVFISELAAGGDGAFTRDMRTVVQNTPVENGLVDFEVRDQWAQDYFEVLSMSMPTKDGLHTIDVFLRSANIVGRGVLRQAGRVVYTEMRGPDVAGLTEVDWNHDQFWDTLNSFGNAETIPPHEGFPAGRILRGKANGLAGDDRVYGMFEAQKVQAPLYIDTGWLVVGHVDETVSFIKDHNNDSWKLMVNDARMARSMLQNAQEGGFAETVMHAGRRWVGGNFREIPADISIAEVLDDANIMAASAEAIVEIDDQVEIIVDAVGLTEDQIIKLPFLHYTQSGYSVAFQPGVVNGISLGDEHFAAPEMHGPIVNGNDIFAQVVEEAITAEGVTVHWIEDWDMFHRFQGEVHCGSNTQRIAKDAWWTSPLGGKQ